jgi:hypothetical protein
VIVGSGCETNAERIHPAAVHRPRLVVSNESGRRARGAIEPMDGGDQDGPNGIYLVELGGQPGGPVGAVG